jgi:hypothetical protein
MLSRIRNVSKSPSYRGAEQIALAEPSREPLPGRRGCASRRSGHPPRAVARPLRHDRATSRPRARRSGLPRYVLHRQARRGGPGVAHHALRYGDFVWPRRHPASANAPGRGGLPGDTLLPAFAKAGWLLPRVLTDGGHEFKGTFDEVCAARGIRHTRTKPPACLDDRSIHKAAAGYWASRSARWPHS